MGVWLTIYLRPAIVALVALMASLAMSTYAVTSLPAPLNTNASVDIGLDFAPQLTTDGIGNWVATWHSTDSLGGTIRTDSDILLARSTDNGITWSTPMPLNTNAASDSGNDQNVQITTDGLGNWLAVWKSDDTLGGTIGSDDDILVSRSTDNGATWGAAFALNTNATGAPLHIAP